MSLDIRTAAATYYDLSPHFPDDIPFYQALIPSSQATILELGCGTGRVTVGLSPHCAYLHGIDLSPAMLAICRQKLDDHGLSAERVIVEEGNITSFKLDRQFDLIIAPFRVMQNLETDGEVSGLLRGIRQHLAPHGTCVLNAFRPYMEPSELRQYWVRETDHVSWEVPVAGGRVICLDRRRRMNPETLVLYPQLIYQRFAGKELVEEVDLDLVMRCWYPETFVRLIRDHGFFIVNRWGGYHGEVYGYGPELVIQFGLGS